MSYNTRFILLVCSLFFLSYDFVFAKDVHQIRLEESYGVDISSMTVNLNNKKYQIGVDVSWEFHPNPQRSNYIDSNLVVNDIKKFLTTYPKRDDYWEVINHKLGLFLIQKYPKLATITVKLKIPPTQSDNYSHFSQVISSH